MSINTPVFITGLYRSGTTLLSRSLNANPKIFITFDNVHFMRFCYNKFQPLNSKNILRLINNISRRLLDRNNIKIDKKIIISELQSYKNISYSTIYNNIMKNCFLKKTNKLIWGEKTNVAWGSIPNFLKMFPNGKCIFLLRDPRDVLCSFKKMTDNPYPNYLDSIFASLGAFQYAKFLKKKISKNNLFIIKYENFVNEPEKNLKKICKFIGVSYDKEMININSFRDINGEKWFSNTSYSKSINKISTSSIGKWKKEILNEELCLLEMVLKKEIDVYGYNLSEKKFSTKDLAKSFEIISASSLLTERFKLWLEENRGVDTYPNNPTWQPVKVDFD